ncbi:hypothetical protein G4Y79_19450 [Phototrophicus methaneseepsis]|uniref:Uncharacterized protein n=1 Tax=Phototrophicus methaneseepsis TaxID=2710758 RepID=A0A7S8E7N5_9CHLR|nr:hypothetical protein [Phototrophicus methaneseepsis]QPC81842.1 hypothetical protein G4Y79_19450 [Phototrophicus methaneseepsis]
MGNTLMKYIIIVVSIVTSVAFLGISVISTYEIFQTLLQGDDPIRGEMWVLLIMAFTGGVILLSMAWGIAELTESRRVQREVQLNRSTQGYHDDEDI